MIQQMFQALFVAVWNERPASVRAMPLIIQYVWLRMECELLVNEILGTSSQKPTVDMFPTMPEDGCICGQCGKEDVQADMQKETLFDVPDLEKENRSAQ
jgi:hypothetical protein